VTVFGVFIPDEPEIHVEILRAFVSGLDRHGLQHEVHSLGDGYRECDVVVTFGVPKKRTPRGLAIEKLISDHSQHLQARPSISTRLGKHLVIERGFIHRDRYFMVGWDGLNGRANYLNQHSRPDRWHQLNVELQPWRRSGETIVLCGQVPWDASVQDSDHVGWCRSTAVELASLTQRPIVFRPHPLQPNAIDMSDRPVRFSNAASLQEDLQNAWAVVTYSSNAGVEATLAGIPAFAADRGAMGYEILNRDLTTIEQPAMPDRAAWLSNLAYTQWTADELADGLAIEHLWVRQQSLLRCVKRVLMSAWRHMQSSNLRRAA
jgi:hypothetical protein